MTPAELDAIQSRAIEFHSEPIEELPDLDHDLAIDPSTIEAPGPTKPTAPATTPAPSTRATKISIRVPGRTLAAFKAQAAKRGTGYQTLIVQTLRAAAAGWERPPL